MSMHEAIASRVRVGRVTAVRDSDFSFRKNCLGMCIRKLLARPSWSWLPVETDKLKRYGLRMLAVNIEVHPRSIRSLDHSSLRIFQSLREVLPRLAATCGNSLLVQRHAECMQEG